MRREVVRLDDARKELEVQLDIRLHVFLILRVNVHVLLRKHRLQYIAKYFRRDVLISTYYLPPLAMGEELETVAYRCCLTV